MAKQTDNATTLSTRFTRAEMADLRRAADLKKWSLSQLLRAGAHEKAQNILNAHGPVVYPIRRLLERVVQQLLRAKVMVRDGPPGGVEMEYERGLFTIPPECDLFATTLPPDTAVKLEKAICALGGELAEVLREEFARVLLGDQEFSVLQGSADPSAPSTEPATDSDTASEAHPFGPKPASNSVTKRKVVRTSRSKREER